MAYSVPVPFFCVKLHFHSGGTILSPLSDIEMMVMDESIRQLSARFRELYQKEVLNKGDFIQTMDLISEGDYYKANLTIPFEAARDKISFPAFELEFEYFFKILEEGIWAVVPALGVETFCKSRSNLDENLTNAIRLEFLRKKRLSSVQNIVSAIWFDYAELLQKEVLLNIPSLQSFESGSGEKQDRLLPKVAKLIRVHEKATYGRKAALEQLLRALRSSFNRNILLVGPSGVGKTSLVWEMVLQSKKRRISGTFWETTASVMIKELTGDTGWEDNMVRFCQELSTGNEVLFVRNLLELFEVGKYAGNEVSMADFMRSYISRGEISMITECTEEELARIQLQSPNFTTFFQIIKIQEPTAELEDIILKKVKDIASNRNLSIEQGAIEETIRLNRRFTPYAGFPGKPIRFLESILLNRKEKSQIVGRKDIIASFCEETGMPGFIVDPEIPMDIDEIKTSFNQKVFGQEQAVESITNLLASVKTALTRVGKPIASLLFVGPTGVGKTEMAKILAQFMFGSRDRMLRFDMSEYADPWSILRLTGESYFTDGLLTSAVRREPFSVLLFDEIEKAHPDFYDLLLQILGEGRLTDSRGKLVNFCSSIIIMTSNIGAGAVQNSGIGWKGVKPDSTTANAQFVSAVQKHFRPELFNRIDKVIPFNSLSRAVVRSVVERELELLKKREGVEFRKMDLLIRKPVLNYLGKKGFHPKYGARQLQRVIREELIIPLAKELNLYDYDDQLVVEILLENDQISLHIEADPLAIELLLEELDKINYADYASELRRKIYQLQEGHIFIRLLSQLDIYEVEKSKAKADFWKNARKSKRYADNLHFKQQMDKMREDIEVLEKRLSLACLGLGAYNPSVTEQLKAWEENFMEFKIKLLSHEKAESNSMSFAIYGNQLKRILSLYLEIFRHRAIEFKAKTVWFREHYYKTNAITGSKGEDYVSDQDVYLKKEWDGRLLFFPEKEEDSLYGIEFQLKGECVLYFLEDEEGLHRWKMSDQEDQLYVIRTSANPLQTPFNIHRKDFYKGSPRRIYSPQHFKDTKLKINREVAKNQFAELIIATLVERFKMRINGELA